MLIDDRRLGPCVDGQIELQVLLRSDSTALGSSGSSVESKDPSVKRGA